MSIQTTAATDSTAASTESIESEYNNIGDIIINRSELTQKARMVLLAYETLQGEPNCNLNQISERARVSHSYVRYVLAKFLPRDQIPASCRKNDNCSPNKEYDDLTDIQRCIINERVINPDLTQAEIAEIAGCCEQNVYQTLHYYEDIVEQVEERICG